MANDPIHQFQIHNLSGSFNLGGYDISFTNSALFMGATVAVIPEGPYVLAKTAAAPA